MRVSDEETRRSPHSTFTDERSTLSMGKSMRPVSFNTRRGLVCRHLTDTALLGLPRRSCIRLDVTIPSLNNSYVSELGAEH